MSFTIKPGRKLKRLTATFTPRNDGVPAVYEEGGDGTGGAFNSMIDDDDD